MKVLRGKMLKANDKVFDLGTIGEETGLTDMLGNVLKVGDVVELTDAYFDKQVEETIKQFPLSFLLSEEELEEAIKEVKKELLSDSNMMKMRFSVVTRHIRKEGNYCIVGFANSINDTTLSGVAEASNFLTKKDMSIEEFLNSDSNELGLYIEEI